MRSTHVWLLTLALVLLTSIATPSLEALGTGKCCHSCVPIEQGQYSDNGACNSCSTSGTYHIRVKTNGEIRRSYIWFDISGIGAPVESARLTIEADYKGSESSTVGVYVMGSWSCSYTPSSGDLIGSAVVSGDGNVTFDLDASSIDWTLSDLYLCLAMTDEQPTAEERHVDFDNPCLTFTYEPCAGYVVSYSGRSYDPGVNTTTFTYVVTVDDYAPYATSHWVLALPDCITVDDIESAGPDWDGEVHTDPTTGVRGIKFESSIKPGSSKTFAVTLYGNVQEQTIEYSVKAGTEVCKGTTTGPTCPPIEADLEVAKTCHDLVAGATGQLAYTIVVTNNGPAASGVTLEDNLATGLSNATYELDDVDQGAWTGSVDLGTMAAGESHTIKIYADVDSELSGSISNTASVTATTADPNPNNNSSTCSNSIPCVCDPCPVANDDYATTDEDTSVTIDVLANDTGDSLVVSSVTQPSHGRVVNNGNNVTYTPDPDYCGEDSFTYTISDSDGYCGCDQGGQGCQCGGCNPDDGTATVHITVNCVDDQPVLEVVKQGPASAAVGDQVTYTIQVSHAAASDGSPVSGITVTDDVAGAATYVSGDDGDGLLEAGETWVYEVSYTIQPTDVDPLTNTACASGLDMDGDQVQKCNTHTTQITPSISIDDVFVIEGDTATFTVSLSNPSASQITVDYATADGTAFQPDDYTQAAGTLTFAPGETSKQVQVTTVEDAVDEPDETFLLNLSNAVNATIADDQGVGTILDDDGTPSIVVDDVWVTEGVDANAVFTLALSNPSASNVTVYYATADNTATQPGDYTATSGTAMIPAGSLSTTVSVPIVDDAVSEPTESSYLNLSEATNTTIADPQGIATILDDDVVSYTLTIAYAGSGDGITDPTAGSHVYPEGTVVSPSATPAPGSRFDGWSGPHAGDIVGDQISMDGDKDLVANFSLIPVSLSVDKIGNATEAAVGDTIDYTIVVTNTGEDTLIDIRVVDALLELDETIPSLTPGANVVFTRTYTATAEDRPEVVNEATASADYFGRTVQDTGTWTVTLNYTAAMTLEKEAVDVTGNPLPGALPGDEVIYRYILSNADNVPLTDITLTDDVVGDITSLLTGDFDEDGVLDVGEVWVYEAVYVVTTADAELGLVENTVVARGSGPLLELVEATATYQLPIVAGGAAGVTTECDGGVIISEVAWAGTPAYPADEWIELRNIGSVPVDLTGWVIRWRKKDPQIPEGERWRVVELSGVIQPSDASPCLVEPTPMWTNFDVVRREANGTVYWELRARVDEVRRDPGYFLLERGDDETVRDVPAGLVYDPERRLDLDLPDEGAVIELVNAAEEVVDTANADPRYPGWAAGDLYSRATMERTDPLSPDVRENWHTNYGLLAYGQDRQDHDLLATAGGRNEGLIVWTALPEGLAPVTPDTIITLPIEVLREAEQEGWPRVIVGVETNEEVAGGGAAVAYGAIRSVRRNGTYILSIDPSALLPGEYQIWIVRQPGWVILLALMSK